MRLARLQSISNSFGKTGTTTIYRLPAVEMEGQIQRRSVTQIPTVIPCPPAGSTYHVQNSIINRVEFSYCNGGAATITSVPLMCPTGKM
jgi:hypothetical protein